MLRKTRLRMDRILDVLGDEPMTMIEIERAAGFRRPIAYYLFRLEREGRILMFPKAGRYGYVKAHRP